jgi:CRP/FNR family transcriptional regulator, cyclic AMP receptor protein
MAKTPEEARPAKIGLALRGLRQILLPRPGEKESVDAAGSASLAVFGPAPQTATSKRGRDLTTFFKQVELFEELSDSDVKRLAQIAHERSYRDGEYIFEQGRPGVALFIVRSGLVEIVRRKENGEEIPLAMLEPPASFEELAAMGCDVVRWTSARARGPVTVVSLGRQDLDALSRHAPLLANKLLRKLAEITARRLQLLVETQFLAQREQDPKDGAEK